MKLAASVVTALGLLLGACSATDKREAATAVRRADSGLVRQSSLEDNKIILGGSSTIEAALTDPSSVPTTSSVPTSSEFPSSVTAPTVPPSSVPTSTVPPSLVPTSSVPTSSEFPSSVTTPTVPPSSVPFGAPTLTPTLFSTGLCVDDANFRLNGHERLGCVWVSKKRDTRCALVDKAQSQPVSAYCRGTCSESCFTEAPTVVPTIEPTFTPSDGSRCRDDDNFRIGEKEKSCKWVGKNPKKRCGKKSDGSGTKAMDACPSVCNLRCTCTNSKRAFKFDKSRVVCKIIRKAHCKAASGKKIVADHCPKKCNDCYPGIIIQ